MKVSPLDFNILYCILALLYISANCTTGIHSRDKRNDLQEDLNKFEIAIQNLLSHDGSSEKAGSSRAALIDTSFGSKNVDEQAHKDGELEERLTGSRPDVPVAIDMAFQIQKQRDGNQKVHHKFVLQHDAEDNGPKHEEQKKPLANERIQLVSSGDDDDDDEDKKNSSTVGRMNNNLVKDATINNNNVKKDIDVSLHEPRKNNSTNDLIIPDAIDLAFPTPNGPAIKSPTRTKTTKPTTLYWPPTTRSSSTPSQICRSKIDLGFLVEASKSVARTGPGNYRRLMNFVKHVVLKFAIGPKATRIGLISYANRPILLMGFHDGENILDVLKYLSLPCHHCWHAQTGLALSFAQSHLYGCSCNLRQRVLVVVTDGSSSDGVHIPSRILKQKGVKIIAVGVGRYFNIDQLNAMASRPAKHNVFTGDFSGIHHVTKEIVRQICSVADGSMVPSNPSPCSCP